MAEKAQSPLNQDIAYGCLFCQTGQEQNLAALINRVNPEIKAFAAMQEQFRTLRGRKTLVEKVWMPGYVFFSAPWETAIDDAIPKDHVIRILTTDRGVWQLYGDDERFVRWLCRYGGMLGLSQAYEEGRRIRILSGPMKDLEGHILRVDRRGHSGQVTLEFCGKTTLVWLCFDLTTAHE